MHKNPIDKTIDDLLKFMGEHKPDSEEYGKAVDNLIILCDARSKKPSRIVEYDTILLVAANIAGILLILNYEQLHPIASKALGFIARGRL
jgi:preprotein translocase subunit Sss1